MSVLSTIHALIVFYISYVFSAFQVIVADNYFTGSKDNLKKWIGHPRFELIRHGMSFLLSLIKYAQYMVIL